jgi:hypothetical protein
MAQSPNHLLDILPPNIFATFQPHLKLVKLVFGDWPAPGSEDTELGVLMGPEVRHGTAKVHARVQA